MLYGDGAGAIEAWRSSLALDPAQHIIWNFLGGQYGKQRDFAKAEECFSKAVSLKPDFDMARRNLEKVRAIKR